VSIARVYVVLFVSAFKTDFSFKGHAWIAAVGVVVQVIAKLALWTSVGGAKPSILGASVAAVVSYAVVAGVILVAWNYGDLIRLVGNGVSTGDITLELLRPLPYLGYLLATQLGVFSARVLAATIPAALVLAAFGDQVFPSGPEKWALFLMAALLGFLIIFLLATLCGLLSFWLMTSYSLDWFLAGILAVFSGSFLPLWMLPDGLRNVALTLPFAWVSYYPSLIFIGGSESGLILFVGMTWVGVLSLAVVLLWRRAVARLVTQGG